MRLKAPCPPKTDKRLLGTWRSDKDRTLKEWAFKATATRKHRRVIRGVFGKLRITYTRKYIHYVLGDWRQKSAYRIICRDPYSIAILYWDSMGEEWRAEYIRFDGKNSYWVPVGYNREFFKKVTQKRYPASVHRTSSARFGRPS
jgi:hypothetical protein